ncbi:MAG: thiol:disulfide interchange protein DsbA/DsbL [Rhizobacter sp.]
MKRRAFSNQLLGLSLGAGLLPRIATAQTPAGFVEGKDYVRLSQPLPLPTTGKIEVLEFFWYGCPHCNSFEPLLDSWAKKLPDDVAFRRVPVAFREETFGPHQKIFYALEAMGLVSTMHRKVFFAIHVERAKLDKLPEIAAFMAKNGVDAAKFSDAYNSFGVNTKATQARKLAEAYRIDGVPAMGIQGRYWTSATIARSPERSLAVADALIALVRKKS